MPLKSRRQRKYLCYVKQLWGSPWVEVPLLRCGLLTHKSAPTHSTADFVYDYGKGRFPETGSRAADGDYVRFGKFQ